MTWLMLGRLFALLYHLLVTRGDVVIPSSETKKENEEE
jgi:hypothetical protein